MIIVKLIIALSIIVNLVGANHPVESIQNVCPEPICDDKSR